MPTFHPYGDNTPATKYGPRSSRTSSDFPYHSLGTLTRMVQGLFIVLIGLGIIQFFSTAVTRSLLTESLELKSNVQSGYGRNFNNQNQLRNVGESFKTQAVIHLILQYAMLLFAAALGFAFLGWVYSASSNLPALGYFDRRFQPVVAVLLLLVPILNIFISLPIISEIAIGSDPNRITPQGHRSGDMSGLAVCWWLLALLSTLFTVFYLALVFDPAQTPAAMLGNLSGGLLLSLVGELPLIAGWYLVGTVFENQEKRHKFAKGMSRRPDFA